MTTPGVGVLVALTFVSAANAPERFRSSRAVRPHFGLTQGAEAFSLSSRGGER
ncbi:transposase [Sinorhizobium meliloti]|uniref:transposase n=1 Tax=Rhizobium meliloti TaxID=382 RepID=UPI00399B8C5A